MGAHALLSPSSAHRWLNCTAAPKLEALMEDQETSFAAEGTLAHAYCAMKLKELLNLSVEDEEKEIEEYSRYYSGEMDEHTDNYTCIVMEKFNSAKKCTSDAQLLVETRLDFSTFIPEAFGTADAVIIADGLMEVIDFKYGKGVKVSAYDNPQMKIYALGALVKFADEYNIERVKMTIVQPRLDNISEYEIDVDALQQWCIYSLQPAAEEAYSGKGQQCPGEWCQFCKVKARCRSLANKAKSTINKYPDMLLSSDEIAEVLPDLPVIKSWLTAMEAHALDEALKGTRIRGYKVVEGRSIRVITDADKVALILNRSGYKTAEIYKPIELRTITDLEKLCGKKAFAEMCGEYINKPQGKPTLVPESDKRPEWNNAATDFAEI